MNGAILLFLEKLHITVLQHFEERLHLAVKAKSGKGFVSAESRISVLCRDWNVAGPEVSYLTSA